MSQWHIVTNFPLVQHCHKVACLWLHLSNITWLCSSSSISNIFCQSNFRAVAEIALQQSCYCMTWSETWVHPVSKTHWATHWSQLLLECAGSSASSQSVRCPSNPSSLLTFPDFLLILLRFQFKVVLFTVTTVTVAAGLPLPNFNDIAEAPADENETTSDSWLTAVGRCEEVCKDEKVEANQPWTVDRQHDYCDSNCV